ncbi:putative membrane protein [Bacillus mycoides]|nr:putative membrane protein [Bacillus mycoides]
MEGPELLWSIWGVALFGATIAYYYRRRGTCKYCKQVIK